MKTLKRIFTGVGLLACVALSTSIFADDKMDADDFVDEASAKGIAELEAAKLALEKSSSQDIKAFAQKMIDDHSKANAELTSIAKRKNLEVATESELKSKVKSFILDQREGESFDEAYANNQVNAHQEAVELFRKGTNTNDVDINAFARTTLPKLESHLKMAQELARKAKAANVDNKVDNRVDSRMDNTTMEKRTDPNPIRNLPSSEAQRNQSSSVGRP